MKKTNTFGNFIFNTYLGLACLISGIILCFSVYGATYGVVIYNFPKLQSSWEEQYSYGWENGKKILLSAEEREVKKAELTEKRYWDTLRSLLGDGIRLVIAGLVFMFHWRLFRRYIE